MSQNNTKTSPKNRKLIQNILIFDGLLFMGGAIYLYLTPTIGAEYLGFDDQMNMIFSGALGFVGLATILQAKFIFGKKDETK